MVAPAGRGLVLAGVLLTASVGCGCALNDYGLVRVRRLENPSARVVQLDAWGAHLVVGAGDSGLTVGHSHRLYVFARDDRPASASISTLLDEGAADLKPWECDPCPRLDEMGTPVLTVSRSNGIALDSSDQRVGFAIGLRRRAVFGLPSEGSVVALVQYDSEHESSTRITIGKEIAK